MYVKYFLSQLPTKTFWPCLNYGYADPHLRNGQTYMKEAECTETNEKSIFRFLVFEIRSF